MALITSRDPVIVPVLAGVRRPCLGPKPLHTDSGGHSAESLDEVSGWARAGRRGAELVVPDADRAGDAGPAAVSRRHDGVKAGPPGVLTPLALLHVAPPLLEHGITLSSWPLNRASSQTTWRSPVAGSIRAPEGRSRPGTEPGRRPHTAVHLGPDERS